MAAQFGKDKGLKFPLDVELFPIVWQNEIVYVGLTLAQQWHCHEMWHFCEDPDRMLIKVSGLKASKAIIKVCDSPLNKFGELLMHCLVLDHNIE